MAVAMHLYDPVHGRVELEGFESEMLEISEIQRLHHVKQLGVVMFSPSFVTAIHTRFSHTLGVLNMAKRVVPQVNLDEEEAKTLRLAALLHDIGHGPFSHFSEKIVRSLGEEVRHEEESKRIILHSDNIDSIWSRWDLPNKSDVGDLVACGKSSGILHDLLCGGLDIDRMDYLLREGHHLGLSTTPKTLDRLIAGLKRVEDRYRSETVSTAVLDGKYTSEANALLMARISLRPTLYMEKYHRAFEAVMRRVFHSAIAPDGATHLSGKSASDIKSHIFGTEKNPGMTDGKLIRFLKQADPSFSDCMSGHRIWDCFEPKEYRWDNLASFIQEELIRIEGKSKYEKTYRKEKEYAKDIVDSIDCLRPDEVYIDIPPLGRLDEAGARIIWDDRRIQRLCDYSEITRSLERSYREGWSMVVFIRLSDGRKLRKNEVAAVKEKLDKYFEASGVHASKQQ